MFFLSKILNIKDIKNIQDTYKCFLSYKDNVCYEFINADNISFDKCKYFHVQKTGIYTNLIINFNCLEELLEIIKKECKECRIHVHNTKVCIDFFGINIGKLMHYGHMRTLIYGNILSKIYKFFNYDVTTDTHFGDGISHIIKYCFFFKKNNFSISDITKLSLAEINEIYIKANEYNIDLDNEDIKILIHDLNIKDTYAYRIKKYIQDISYEYAINIADMLGVKFKFKFYESRYTNLCEYLKAWGIDNNFFRYDNNNRILTTNGLVLTNRNQYPIYAFTDLATVIERYLYGISKILYVVDKRQHQHFEMLFSFIKSVNLKIDLHHIKYGYVYNIEDKIISSRHINNNTEILGLIQSLIDKGYSAQDIRLGFVLYETRHRLKSDYIFIERMFLETLESARQFLKIKELIEEKIDKIDKCKTELSATEQIILTRCVQMYESIYMCIYDNNIDRFSFLLHDLKSLLISIDTENISYSFCLYWKYFDNLFTIVY